MAFQVTFYTNPKKHNSTALPSGNGSPYNCTAKEPLSIQSPTIILRLADGAAGNPVNWNYAYIAAIHRYYWIVDWINEGPNWAASMQVDVLASFRDAILSYSPYVLRAFSEFDGTIPDTLYPAKHAKTSRIKTLTNHWTGVPDWHDFDTHTDKGCFVVGIASMGFLKYYVFNAEGLYQLVYYLVSDAYAEKVLGALQLNLYPDAKIAVNPMQYITSVMYIPNMDYYNSGTTVSSINIGPVSVSVNYCKEPTNQMVKKTYTEIISLVNYKHPEANTKGIYLNTDPWTSYELFYPPFGLIKLDSTYLGITNSLQLEIVLDGRTGEAILTVSALLKDTDNPDSVTNFVVLAKVNGFVGVQIPITALNTRQPNMLTQLSQIFTGASSLVSGNAQGVITSVTNAIGDSTSASTPHLSIIGNDGSAASLSGTPQLILTYTEQAEELNRELGRPLCKSKILSSLSPGYILCLGADLAISGTQEEQNKINSFLNGGMFLA